MNFLFIAPRFHTNMQPMIKALQNKGHQLGFLAMYQGQSEDYGLLHPDILGYAKIFLIINKIFNKSGGKLIKNDFEIKHSYPPLLTLFKKIKTSQAQVVVIKNIQSPMSIWSMIFAKLLNKKIIILLQLDKYRPKAKSFSVSFVGKVFGAKVVTPIFGDHQHKNKNQNLFYIPFAIDAEDFGKKYFINNKINIIAVGKFQERKGHLILAQSINQLKNNFDFNITFIGEQDEQAYLDKLRQYIQENNLPIKIKMNLKHDQVLNEYKNHDLFILPSWSEAAAFSPLEAMSCKLPVISSDGNGTRCYIEPGINGYIFKQRDVEDLVNKIKLIIQDKDNLIKMGQVSFDLARQKYSLEKFYQDFITLIS